MAQYVRAVPIVLVLLGLALLSNPLYLFPHATETSNYVDAVEQTETAQGRIIAFDALPPAAQEAFEAAVDGRDSDRLWSHDDAEAIAALSERDAVRYEGAVYSYRLTHGDRTGNGIVRTVVAVLGGFLFALGAVARSTGSVRPSRPEPGLVIVLAVVTALVWVMGYEIAFEGRESLGITFGSALFGSFLAFVVGISVRQRNRRWTVYGIVGACLVTIVGGFALGITNVASTLVTLPVISLPWFLLGFAFASPGDGRLRDLLTRHLGELRGKR